MKAPKGFGKNYFTFSAILAYSVQNKLQSQISSIHSLFLEKSLMGDDNYDENDPPDELLEVLICTQNQKPSHCDCYFKLKTKLIIRLFHFIPRCPYYTTCFAFRRTGVHPPFFILIFTKSKNKYIRINNVE